MKFLLRKQAQEPVLGDSVLLDEQVTPRQALGHIYKKDLGKAIRKARQARATLPQATDVPKPLQQGGLSRFLGLSPNIAQRTGFILPSLSPKALDDPVSLKVAPRLVSRAKIRKRKAFVGSSEHQSPTDPLAEFLMTLGEEASSHMRQPAGYSAKQTKAKIPLAKHFLTRGGTLPRPKAEIIPGALKTVQPKIDELVRGNYVWRGHEEELFESEFGSGLRHAMKSIEFAPKLSRLKQFYYLKTGNLISTRDEALAGWRWVRDYITKHPEAVSPDADAMFYVNPDSLDPSVRDQILDLMTAVVKAPQTKLAFDLARKTAAADVVATKPAPPPGPEQFPEFIRPYLRRGSISPDAAGRLIYGKGWPRAVEEARAYRSRSFPKPTPMASQKEEIELRGGAERQMWKIYDTLAWKMNEGSPEWPTSRSLPALGTSLSRARKQHGIFYPSLSETMLRKEYPVSTVQRLPHSGQLSPETSEEATKLLIGEELSGHRRQLISPEDEAQMRELPDVPISPGFFGRLPGSPREYADDLEDILRKASPEYSASEAEWRRLSRERDLGQDEILNRLEGEGLSWDDRYDASINDPRYKELSARMTENMSHYYTNRGVSHALKSAEFPVKVAAIKQLYYMKTGRLVRTAAEALDAWRWAHKYVLENPGQIDRAGWGLFFMDPDKSPQWLRDAVTKTMPAVVKAPRESRTKLAFDLSSESNTTTLYHGSTGKLSEIKPRSGALLGEPAVFATPDRDVALVMSRKWTDRDLSFGKTGNDPYVLREKYPGALKKLMSGPGYIHTLSDVKAESHPKIQNWESIVRRKVTPSAVEKIDNVLDALEESSIKIVRKEPKEKKRPGFVVMLPKA